MNVLRNPASEICPYVLKTRTELDRYLKPNFKTVANEAEWFILYVTNEYFYFYRCTRKNPIKSIRSSEKWKERVGKFFIWTRRILTTFNFVDSVLPKRVLDSPDSLSIIAKIISRLFGIKVGIAYFIFLFYLDHFESDDWSSY